MKKYDENKYLLVEKSDVDFLVNRIRNKSGEMTKGDVEFSDAALWGLHWLRIISKEEFEELKAIMHDRKMEFYKEESEHRLKMLLGKE